MVGSSVGFYNTRDRARMYRTWISGVLGFLYSVLIMLLRPVYCLYSALVLVSGVRC